MLIIASKDVVRIPHVWLGLCSVAASFVFVNQVKCIFPSDVKVNIFVEFWEDRLEIAMVEVCFNNKEAFGLVSL